MNIIIKQLGEIKPYEKNPRKNDKAVDGVMASIKEFGFKVPIVIDKDGVIVTGHTRYKAAKKLKLQEVPCIMADDLTEEQIKAYRLADNKVAEAAEWDFDLLGQEMDDIFNIDMLQFGFEEPEEIAEVVEDDFEVVVPDEPKAKLGQIYQLGRHRLMCGDSTKAEDVEKLMDGAKADLVFTDHPYGVSYEGGHNKKKRKGIIADELDGENLTGLFYHALTNAISNTKDGAAFYVWYASGKSIETYASLSKLPLEIRAVIQWYKIKSGLGAFMSQYIPNCEPCMYLHKKGCSPAWYGPTTEKTVWELKRSGANEYHPTQKPVELPARAINNSSKAGDLVIDLFGGSGSTLIAAEQTSRICHMMELDPRYIDVIIERWEKFTGQKAVLLNAERD